MKFVLDEKMLSLHSNGIVSRNSTYIRLLEILEHKSTDSAQSHILPENQTLNLLVKYCQSFTKILP